MRKMPKKIIGDETIVEGHVLVCKLTGKSFNGVEGTAWFHKESGDQAFRSINGAITFIEPNETSITQTRKLPETDKQTMVKYAEKMTEEQYVWELAWNICEKRYPDMNHKTDVFGMIVNAVVTRLITI